MVIRESFPCKNIPEILDPSCKTGLDIWARFKGEKLSNSRVTHDWFHILGTLNVLKYIRRVFIECNFEIFLWLDQALFGFDRNTVLCYALCYVFNS